MTLKLGLIVNPYAGIDGSLGLKGSDGDAIRHQALASGAQLRAVERMRRCLQLLAAQHQAIHVFGFAGEMGETLAQELGFSFTCVGKPQSPMTSAEDTLAAVAALLAVVVDIIVFAGGDGTARNIVDALQKNHAPEQVVLGVPSGVKMHSGVYAISPEAAGEILRGLLSNHWINVQYCDVKDIDEAAFREGKVKTRHYGAMRVPCAPQFLQQVKNSGAYQDESVKIDIAHYLIDHLQKNTLYIVGPGSTTQCFLTELGVEGSLLGIDVVLNNQLVAKDVNANQLEKMMEQHAGDIQLLLTAIGGQGHILGRGNQQLTPSVLARIPRSAIHIIATKEKIQSLAGRPLLVDSNDPDLDRQFSGYQPVLVGYDETILYPIGIAESI